MFRYLYKYLLPCLLISPLLCVNSILHAAVVAEDRADILYHSYDGGGVEITGPSVLVRKKFGESFSASVNHYIDNVSSASIDVVTTASAYTEHREENSIGFDYLNNKTMMTVSVTKSLENDFDASTLSLNFSQDMFGDLTTLSMGFARGDNEIGRRGDDNFKEQADVRSYRLGLSQILSKNLIVSFALEGITDEGYLNNPYRQVRYLDGSNYLYQSEVYPGTRNSSAFAVRARYFFEPRQALHGGVRTFSDSWGIDATSAEIGYIWTQQPNWIFETHLRYYEQSSADFYSDLFPFENAQNFLARDKELSSFTDITIGGGVTFEFNTENSSFFKRGSLNLYYDYIQFDYDNFRDLTKSGSVGNEPLYSFSANVIRAYASFWF